MADPHRHTPSAHTSLPPVAAADISATPDDQMLDPRIVPLWRFSALLETGFLLGAVAVVLSLIRLPFAEWPLIAGIAALAAWYAAVIPQRQYRAWGYQLRSEDVRVRRGIWWRTVSVVPNVRIQHVDTRQGPLERHFGLATLVLFTAGSVGASIEIPGLPAERAQQLREHLAAVTGSDDAV